MGGGGTTSTTTVNVPGPSASEIALQEKQTELLGLQVEEARRQSSLLAEIFPQQRELLQQQINLTTQLAAEQKAASAYAQQFQEKAFPLQVEQLKLIGQTIEQQAKFQEQLFPLQQRQLELATQQQERQAAFETSLLPLQEQQLRLATQQQERQAEYEARLFPLQEQQVQLQSEAMQRQAAAEQRQAEQYEQLRGEIEQATAVSPQAQEIQRLTEERQLAFLRGEAPPVSSEQQALINRYYAEAEQQAKGGIRQFAEELAASRGLRLSDSPVAQEALRAGTDLASQLAQAKAKAQLDVGQSQQQFQLAATQFASQLQQQALQNRIALATPTGTAFGGVGAPTLPPQYGVPGVSGLQFGAPQAPLFAAPQVGTGQAQLGLGQPGINAYTGLYGPTGGLQSALTGMQQLRLGSASRTTTTSGGGGGFAPILGAAGGLLSGIGALSGFSTARVKRDIAALTPDDEAQWLAALRDVPVTTYRYLWESEADPAHTGIILELSPDTWTRDGMTVDVLGVLGSLLAAVRSLDRQVQAIKGSH